MTLSTVLAWSLPAVIALASLEGLVLTFGARRPYNWRSYAASVTDVLVREYVVYAFVGVSLAGPLIDLAWRHRLATVPLNGFASFALLFLGQEFCYYWYHRAAHRVRWFWATHAVHHSPNEFNLGIAYRFGWTGRIAGNALFFVPLIWLGFAPKAVFAALAFNLLYQFWLHTEWVPKLGWLEYVLNTPSHHRGPPRLEHGLYRRQLRRRADRLRPPVRHLRRRTPRPALPLRAREASDLQQSDPDRVPTSGSTSSTTCAAPCSWRDGLGYLFGPPGWRPARPKASDMVGQSQKARTIGVNGRIA